MRIWALPMLVQSFGMLLHNQCQGLSAGNGKDDTYARRTGRQDEFSDFIKDDTRTGCQANGLAQYRWRTHQYHVGKQLTKRKIPEVEPWGDKTRARPGCPNFFLQRAKTENY